MGDGGLEVRLLSNLDSGAFSGFFCGSWVVGPRLLVRVCVPPPSRFPGLVLRSLPSRAAARSDILLVMMDCTMIVDSTLLVLLDRNNDGVKGLDIGVKGLDIGANCVSTNES